jgi:putative Mg2+ transporter-C (MgtC) family protein
MLPVRHLDRILLDLKEMKQFYIRFDRHETMTEEQVRAILAGHGFTVANMSYRITDDGSFFEYRMILQTADERNTSILASSLRSMKQVRTFQISPTGD